MRGKGSVRIAGGVWRGRAVTVPPGVRPTGGKVREALFSIWSERIAGAALLDLFAGSGAVGLEGLSRGACRALMVEESPRVLRALTATLRQLEAVDARAWRARLPGGLDPPSRVVGQPYDLVFADPPYRFLDFEPLLAAIGPLLAANGGVAIEHSIRTELPQAVGSLELASVRRYGESALSFFGPRQAAPSVR